MGDKIETNLQDAMRQVLKLRGWTYQRMADEVGTKLQNVIDRLCKPHGMSISLLIRYCKAADCEVVIRSKLKDKTEWVITEAVRPEK